MEPISDALTRPSAVPWVIGLGILTMIMTAAPKWFGGAGDAWVAWLNGRRRAAEARDDADIKDLRRQVENLTAELERVRDEVRATRSEMRRRDAALHDHYPWDVQAYQLIIAHLGEGAIGPPPSLWPPEPWSSIDDRCD